MAISLAAKAGRSMNSLSPEPGGSSTRYTLDIGVEAAGHLGILAHIHRAHVHLSQTGTGETQQCKGQAEQREA